jgi:RNA polymerase sigma-70 factor, ECF subfamily
LRRPFSKKARRLVSPKAQAAGGDLRNPQAFEAFYSESLSVVYGYFFNRCAGNRGVAEDLTQETFMSAVSEIKKGTAIGAPTPWVLGIARHKLMDHYRSREREERKFEAVTQETVAEDVLWSGEESRDRAVAALDRVAGPQRAALVLRYLDGLSVPEVASVIGKSVHATESLLARGRNSFRITYEEDPNA